MSITKTLVRVIWQKNALLADDGGRSESSCEQPAWRAPLNRWDVKELDQVVRGLCHAAVWGSIDGIVHACARRVSPMFWQFLRTLCVGSGWKAWAVWMMAAQYLRAHNGAVPLVLLR